MPDETDKTDPSSGDGAGIDWWTALRWTAVAVMVLAALAYLVAVPLGAIPHEDRLATAEVLLGVALIAGFAFFGSLTQVDITAAGVSFKIRDLVRRQDELQKELDGFRGEVVELFLNTMAPSMYEQLLKLRTGNFRGYEKTPDFQREMTNLRDAGYVSDFDWNDVPDKEEEADLSEHIHITPLGENFLRLRAQLEKQAGPQPQG